MEYIVLIIDMQHNRDFKIFPTEEEAIAYAHKVMTDNYITLVNKLTYKIYL